MPTFLKIFPKQISHWNEIVICNILIFSQILCWAIKTWIQIRKIKLEIMKRMKKNEKKRIPMCFQQVCEKWKKKLTKKNMRIQLEIDHFWVTYSRNPLYQFGIGVSIYKFY